MWCQRNGFIVIEPIMSSLNAVTNTTSSATASAKADAFGTAAGKLQWIASAFTSQARIMREMLSNTEVTGTNEIKARLAALAETSADLVGQATAMQVMMTSQEKMWMSKRTDLSPFYSMDGKRQLTYHEISTRYAVAISMYAYHAPAVPDMLYENKYSLPNIVRRMAKVILDNVSELEYKNHYLGYYPDTDELLLIVVDDDDNDAVDDDASRPRRHLYASIRPVASYAFEAHPVRVDSPDTTTDILPLNYPTSQFWNDVGFRILKPKSAFDAIPRHVLNS
jgi:hypothetical protein